MTSPDSRPPPSEPGARFGKYILERRIAVGGSSEVYVARPVRGDLPAKTLVIKRLIPEVLEDPQSLGTFAMEARLHRAAIHPNVVEVFEAGSVDGEPYLAMEYIDGVDLHRLMRRTQVHLTPICPSIAVMIAREMCAALSCVHCAVDDNGHPLAVVHRDVTPSNVYLSRRGDVKLGDFGIARTLGRPTLPADTTVLKGKFAYLSPEQVAGEDFDHRADLFSLAVMLSEMLINQPLFPGSGQLAVLLAIRDCRIDRLRDHASCLPPGLVDVLVRALARKPNDRYGTALALSAALEPFDALDRPKAQQALGALLASLCEQSATGSHPPRSSNSSGRFDAKPPGSDRSSIIPAAETQPSRVRTQDGKTMGPLAFSKIVELAATSRLKPEDEVDLAGVGFRRIADTPEIERHIAPLTMTTCRLRGPDIPDYIADFDETPMLEVCAHMVKGRETGVLFVEREARDGFHRKEIYLAQARVVHVASTEASELLGEYLVGRGLLSRAELELALTVLPHYGGKLGDTLIGLDLMDAVEIFRVIREQGRDRIADVFRWASGKVTFYRGMVPTRVEFPLDLDLVPLMLVGTKAAYSDEAAVFHHRSMLDDLLVGITEVPDTLKLAAWPPEILKVVGAAGEGRSEREIVSTLAGARLINMPSALRAIDVACAAGLLQRVRRHMG